jgi:hypothetical protein
MSGCRALTNGSLFRKQIQRDYPPCISKKPSKPRARLCPRTRVEAGEPLMKTLGPMRPATEFELLSGYFERVPFRGYNSWRRGETP